MALEGKGAAFECRTAREASSAEYILVDDGSTEDVSVAVDTGRQLQHLFGVAFRLVRNDKPTGHGSASNAGVQAATAKFVALLHCDAHVINGWLRPLIRTIKSSSSVGMVCHTHACGIFFAWSIIVTQVILQAVYQSCTFCQGYPYDNTQEQDLSRANVWHTMDVCMLYRLPYACSLGYVLSFVLGEAGAFTW